MINMLICDGCGSLIVALDGNGEPACGPFCEGKPVECDVPAACPSCRSTRLMTPIDGLQCRTSQCSAYRVELWCRSCSLCGHLLAYCPC
jgi:hypothetical protein